MKKVLGDEHPNEREVDTLALPEMPYELAGLRPLVAGLAFQAAAAVVGGIGDVIRHNLPSEIVGGVLQEAGNARGIRLVQGIGEWSAIVVGRHPAITSLATKIPKTEDKRR